MRRLSGVFLRRLLIFALYYKKREGRVFLLSEEARETSKSMELLAAESREDLKEVKQLFLEYERSTGVSLCFQGFQEELDHLPGKYREPEGVLLLLKIGGKACGCCALKPLEEKICELKRLFVLEEHRGRGISKVLMERILKEARERGYEKIRLDTLDTMKPAIGLYRSVGFEEISAYIYNPLPGARYFEKRL